MSSLIQVSETNAIVYISSSSFFSQLKTIRDTSGTRSTRNTITVSTVGGTFSDGTTTKIIDTPYESITVNPSTGTVLHELPFTYGESIDVLGLTMNKLNVTGMTYIYDSLYLSNMSTTGTLDVQSILVGTNPVYTVSNEVSTIQAIGQSYTSIVYFPMNTLGGKYTSTASLVSTVGSLPYNSYPYLKSTINGLGTTFFSTPSLD